MELADKNIIVTGCASGMGAATVRAYVGAGAQVVGMDIVGEAGEQVCFDATNVGPGNATFMSVDVSNADHVARVFSTAVEQLGSLHALAHPAAIHQRSTATDVTVEEWDSIFAINVRGTMLTNQTAYPFIRDSGGGSIINFGSISGNRPEPGAAAYSAGKGAVHSWTRTAAGTWGTDGVRVNAVLPAMTTPMAEGARQAAATEEQKAERYWRNLFPIALGQQYGDPDTDLGPVMVFLASDASHFITGQLIHVDGGQGNVR